MGSESLAGLQALRDALRSPIPDVNAFVFLLSSCLQALHLHSTSVPPADDPKDLLRYIHRLLPTIQGQLLTSAIPTFEPLLDTEQRGVLRSLFVPPKDSAPTTLPIRRNIAFISYGTLTAFLSTSNPQITPLPLQSRDFVLYTLNTLAAEYGIDELYWAVWSSSSSIQDGRQSDGLRTLRWDEAVKVAAGVVGKVTNAVGRWKSEGWSGDLPAGLVPRSYFDQQVVKMEGLLYEMSRTTHAPDLSSIRVIVQRFASLGLLTARPALDESPAPSLLAPLLPPLLAHIHPNFGSPLPAFPPTFLPSLLLPLPSSTLASFVNSLLDHLAFRLIPPDAESLQPDLRDERIKRAAEVLRSIIGPAKDSGEAIEAVMRRAISGKVVGVDQTQDQARARIVVAWIADSDEKVIRDLIDNIMVAWCDPKNIKFSLYAQQFGLTHMFLLALSLLPAYHPFLVSLSHRPALMTAMQSYLAHPDPKIRRLGMLVAELISELTIEETRDNLQYSQQDEIDDLRAGLEVDEESGDGPASKKAKTKGMSRLKFGKDMWQGEGDGREECRWLRRAIAVRDQEATLSEDPSGKLWLLGWDDNVATIPHHSPVAVPQPKPRERTDGRKNTIPRPQPKIVMLDEDQLADPLVGYSALSPSSSRSPSPTPSFLEEVAADPSLALDSTQKKKVTRPVYIQQLVVLLKEREKPDHIEMGLRWGEGLIRAKRSFGRELEESAVAVATTAISLNDPFNLDGFDERRQGLLTALVVCSPKNVAPFLVEQYFSTHFSLQQKSNMLTALAMGARELAGLAVPTPPSTTRRIDFPSKMLPPALHQRYISPADTRPAIAGQLEEAISGVRNILLGKGAKKGEETVPELAREKRLRVRPGKRTRVTEVGTLADRQISEKQSLSQAPVVPFKDVAADYFIMPLINRFWQHFQDASVREERAVGSGSRYRGAGTGMVLSPMALEKFLMTLALLLDAARHSPLFLAVLSPEALELALTIGSRHLIRPDDNPIAPEEAGSGEESRREASVVSSSLEVCLVCLGTSFELDNGRTLAFDKPQLVLAVGEWAGGIFEIESHGGQVAAGQGGMREGRIKAAAAGVVVKISEIGGKWARLGLLT